MKRCERTQFHILEFHKLRLSKRQLLKKGVRFCSRRYIHQKDGTLLILTGPPLFDLSIEIQTKCSGTSFGNIVFSCSGVGGEVKRPSARILDVGKTGKGRLGCSVVLQAVS